FGDFRALGYDEKHFHMQTSRLMKMKVVHVTSVHSAMDVRILEKECKSLAAHGYEVVLIAPSIHPVQVDGVRVVTVKKPRNRSARLLLTALEVLYLSAQEDADLYHFHDPELIIIGVALKLFMGKIIVYDVHEDLPLQIFKKPWVN